MIPWRERHGPSNTPKTGSRQDAKMKNPSESPKPFADVSAIIPLHNGRRFIREAVASVAGQSVLPREVIVVYDGSEDGGAALLDGLCLPFPVRVVSQENAG